MMTLALYKRPLIILTLFLASALGVYFLAPEQRYAQWQWTQSDEALPTIARYDLIHSYPAQNGALLLISKRSETSAYNSFYGCVNATILDRFSPFLMSAIHQPG
ncbi:hypothetical protein AB3M75_05210 [Serratia ureilytica]|uniref:hypothetical protein n=1 Tax=Serratia ureilytica TaxID=300181 RepID=UPI0037173C90